MLDVTPFFLFSKQNSLNMLHPIVQILVINL